jgi:hypothetical protein
MDDSVSRTLAELDDEALDQLGLLRMPTGSDGKYVRIGERVYTKSGRPWDVIGVSYTDEMGLMVSCAASDFKEPENDEFYPCEVSHRPPSMGLMLLEMLDDLGVDYHESMNKRIVDEYIERFGFFKEG